MHVKSLEDLGHDTQFFANTILFDNVEPASVRHYLNECSVIHINSGDILLSPDKPNAFLYVVISGVLEIYLKEVKSPPLTVLHEGECVGEMSMIEQRTPSALVVAAEPTQVLAISHDILWAMVGASHAVAKNLLIILSGRIRSDNAIISDSAAIITHFQKKSFTDSLTGLNNRRWMEDFFAREIARCQLNNDPAVMAVVDIDHFRAFNNKFGHLVGDLALGTVAEVLSTHFRANDLVARYGGDEFVVLLPNLDLSQAYDVAERVRAAFSEASEKLAETVAGCEGISVSIGLSQMDSDDSLEDLLEKSDKALYRSKSKGRDQVSN